MLVTQTQTIETINLTRSEIVETWFNQDWPMENINADQLTNWLDWYFEARDYVDSNDYYEHADDPNYSYKFNFESFDENDIEAITARINGRALGELIANEWDTPDSDRLDGTTRETAIANWQREFCG